MNSQTPQQDQTPRQDPTPQPENMAAAKPSRKRVWLRRAVELAVVIVVIFGVRAWQQRDIVSGAAPALQGVLLDGKPLSMAAVQAGKPALVHFWATWCPICKTEQASIEALAGDHFNVITVAMQSGTNESVAKFMAEQKLSFPVLNDPDGAISASWGVHAVPASFIVDGEGKIRFVEIGFTTEVGLRLRLWLAQL